MLIALIYAEIQRLLKVLIQLKEYNFLTLELFVWHFYLIPKTLAYQGHQN